MVGAERAPTPLALLLLLILVLGAAAQRGGGAGKRGMGMGMGGGGGGGAAGPPAPPVSLNGTAAEVLRNVTAAVTHAVSNQLFRNDFVVASLVASIFGLFGYATRWLWRKLTGYFNFWYSKTFIRVVVSDSRLYIYMAQWLEEQGVLARSAKFKAVPKTRGQSDAEAIDSKKQEQAHRQRQMHARRGAKGGLQPSMASGLGDADIDVSFLPMGNQETYRVSYGGASLWITMTATEFRKNRAGGGRVGIQGGGGEDTITLEAWNVGPLDGKELIRKLLIEVQTSAVRGSQDQVDLYQSAMSGQGGKVTWEIVSQIQKRKPSTVILGGSTMEDILADVSQFIKKEKWYRERDIPHRRGYLLEGPPGCGKSSLIRVVASVFNLLVLLLTLSYLHQPLCQLSLKHSRVGAAGIEALLHAAPEGAILFLEDVDVTESGGVLKRADTTKAKSKSKNCSALGEFGGGGGGAGSDSGDLIAAAVAAAVSANSGKGTDPDKKVTMSELFNAIDGLGAQTGRLLFMTTNHPEHLDPALIRDGRIDRRFNLGAADRDMARRLWISIRAAKPEEPTPDEAAHAARFGEVVVDGRDSELSLSQLQGFLVRNAEASDGEALARAAALSSADSDADASIGSFRRALSQEQKIDADAGDAESAAAAAKIRFDDGADGPRSRADRGGGGRGGGGRGRGRGRSNGSAKSPAKKPATAYDYSSSDSEYEHDTPAPTLRRSNVSYKSARSDEDHSPGRLMRHQAASNDRLHQRLNASSSRSSTFNAESLERYAEQQHGSPRGKAIERALAAAEY